MGIQRVCRQLNVLPYAFFFLLVEATDDVKEEVAQTTVNGTITSCTCSSVYSTPCFFFHSLTLSMCVRPYPTVLMFSLLICQRDWGEKGVSKHCLCRSVSISVKITGLGTA